MSAPIFDDWCGHVYVLVPVQHAEIPLWGNEMSEAGAKKSENVTFDMEGLVKAVSTKSGINAPQAQKVLRVAMAMISEQIQKGAQTRVPGLGTFLPRTAEGKTRVVFRPAAKKDRQAAMGKTKKEG